MTLLTSSVQALLARYGRADSVVFGTPLANRSRPELEGLIGYFVNTVAIHVDLSGNRAIRKACASFDLQCLKARCLDRAPDEVALHLPI